MTQDLINFRPPSLKFHNRIDNNVLVKMHTDVYICLCLYLLDAVGSSEILKGKQKLGVTFKSDKQDIIDFMKFSKMTMRRASEANSEK